MPRSPSITPEFADAPFRASRAIASGQVSAGMLKGRSWKRLFHDVYINAAAFDRTDHRMWCRAAKLYLPDGGCLGGWSSAYMLGVDILPADPPVWVSVPVHCRIRPRNRLRIHRTPLPATDVDHVAGMPVTTGVRTAFDLGRYLPRTEALIALDALCHREVKLSSLEDLATARWSWPGTRLLRQLMPLIEPRAESPMETRMRLLIIDAGLPVPVVQHEVRTADGAFVGRVDLAYPEWKIAIEYEGDHHRERDQFRRDVARVNALREAGWLVLRFTADDLFRQPDRLLRQVARAILDRR